MALPTNRRRLILALVALSFFAAPAALRLVGVRAKQFENHQLARAPRLSDGWQAFGQMTQYVIDHMPLRDLAVRANTWIDEHVYDTTPQYGASSVTSVQDNALPFVAGSPQHGTGSSGAQADLNFALDDRTAVPGKDGWLFLKGVFARACSPPLPFTAALARWEQLMSVIRASGRRVLLVIAPDKSTIYPEYVSPDDPLEGCGQRGSRALWQVLEARAAARAGVVTLRKAILAAKASTRQLLYPPTNSHWNGLGSLSFARTVVPVLDPRLRVLPSEIVDPGPVRQIGDLTVLQGDSRLETELRRIVVRRPGAETYPGRTLIIGDSYMNVAAPQIQPYLASLSRLSPWTSASGANILAQMVPAIVRAHTVIFENVERGFDVRAPLFTPAFLATLSQALARAR